MITAGDGLKGAVKIFQEAGIETPTVDAWLIVEHVTQWNRAELLAKSKDLLTEAQEKHLVDAIARRVKREPVSRIVGHRGFWKSDFKVTPQTLDPRPDSETLVETALKTLVPPPKTILDLGTGTGCLLLSLLLEWPEATGVGVDISKEAVETAHENAAALGLAGRAKIVESNWEKFESNESFDSIISNPPYIARGEISKLEPEVANYDPRAALEGGEDGLDCYRALALLVPKWLKRGGFAFFEIGFDQKEAVKSILAKAGLDVIQTVPDLAGNDRVVVARRP